MHDVWTDRDLPVLRAYAEYLDDPFAHRSKIDLASATGLTDEQITRALHALDRADPPYLKVTRGMDGIVRVLGGAYRAVGAWPTAEGLADSIAAAFSLAADSESNPKQKSKLKSVATSLTGAGRDIAVQVISHYLTGS